MTSVLTKFRINVQLNASGDIKTADTIMSTINQTNILKQYNILFERSLVMFSTLVEAFIISGPYNFNLKFLFNPTFLCYKKVKLKSI